MTPPAAPNMKEALSLLIVLQAADRDAMDAERRRAEFDRQMDGVNKLLHESKAGVDSAHRTLQEAQALLHRKETELKGREQRILELTGKLNSCTSNKEYQGILVEIGAIKVENGRTEEAILLAMEDVEAKDKLQEAARAKLRETEAIHRAAEAEVAGRRAAFEAELGAAKARRDEIAARVPAEPLRLYERIRAGNRKSGSAVVEVHGEYCQGCQMSINSQEYSDLVAGSRIVMCRVCQRILVLPT